MIRKSSRSKSIYAISSFNKESSGEEEEDEQEQMKVINKSTPVRYRRARKPKVLNVIQTPKPKKAKLDKSKGSSGTDDNKSQESSNDDNENESQKSSNDDNENESQKSSNDDNETKKPSENESQETSNDESKESSDNESQSSSNDSNESQESSDDDALKDWRPKHVIIRSSRPPGRQRKLPSLTPLSTPQKEIEIFCPWIQVPNDELPELILPESSTDLLFPNKLLFDAVEIYETCFNFYRFLSLSPFLFEEFCAALCSPTQNLLLAEIHIAFIRLFFHDAEYFKTTFGLPDTKHNLDIMLEFLDGMNYAEILRQYVKSDHRFKAQHIIDILENSNYPFVDVSKRVQVLKWLCLHLNDLEIINDLFTHQTGIEHDDACRVCDKLGDLILCDGCEACYHLKCAKIKKVPDDLWFCKVCRSYCERGAIDEEQLCDLMLKVKLRIKILGYDRHERMYCFAARRLFIFDNKNNTCVYYSTLSQLYGLIQLLDSDKFEKELCSNLLDSIKSISNEMAKTLKLTKKSKRSNKLFAFAKHLKSYIEIDNSYKLAKIFGDLKNPSNNVKESGDDKSMVTNENEQKQSSKQKINVLLENCQLLLGIRTDNTLMRTEWTDGLDEQELSDLYQELQGNLSSLYGFPSFATTMQNCLEEGYRLGFTDNYFLTYKNEFSSNALAQSNDERENNCKQTAKLAQKFEILDQNNEFLWHVGRNGSIYVCEADVIKILQQNIFKMVEKLPDEFMHFYWFKNGKQLFLTRLNQANNIDELRALLLQLELTIRPCVFNETYLDSFGLTRLERMTEEDHKNQKDLKKKQQEEKKILLSSRDSINPDNDIITTKLSKQKYSVWFLAQMRGEEYRLVNRVQSNGWSWFSKTWTRRFQEPGKLVLPINYTTSVEKPENEATTKALNLYKIAKKLILRRNVREHKSGAFTNQFNCYSTLCYYSPMGFSPCFDQPLQCYNSSCYRKTVEIDTTQIVKAHSQLKKDENFETRHQIEIQSKPPKLHYFRASTSHRQSLFVLPRSILRKLARQGGINLEDQYLPGFKINRNKKQPNWIYPADRATFDTCWRYLTATSNSLHALAMQFQILHACINWDDIQNVKRGMKSNLVSRSKDRIERRKIVSYQLLSPDYRREQYKVVVQAMRYEEKDFETPSRASVQNSQQKSRYIFRERKSLSATKTFCQQPPEERWIDADELELSEIYKYWRSFHLEYSLNGVNNTP